MQTTNGYAGNMNVSSQQLTPQQLQQMMLLQQGGQFGNVMGYNAQYALPAASVGQAQRPASATPPPATAQVQQTQHQQHGLQQQQQASIVRVSDTGDDGFDLDDIPSPGGTPPGAGTGPSATQQQQLHQQYSRPAVSQPAAFVHQQTGIQQQLLLQQQQQQQRRQQQLSGPQVRSQQSMPQQVPQHARPQQQPQPRTVQQQPMHVSHPAVAAQVGQFPKQQEQQQHGITAATRPGAINAAHQQLSAADQLSLHSRKVGTNQSAALQVGPGQPAPGQELPAAAQAALAARQAQQQQLIVLPAQQPQPQQQPQQQPGQQAASIVVTAAAAAGGATGMKRKREAAPLLPAPEEALTLDTVIYRMKQNLPLTAATAAGGGGPAVDGPAVSVDDILKKYEESARAKAAVAGPKPGKAGGRDKRADDEHRLLPESHLKRLMELQGLHKSFRLQPELAEELMKLSDEFVTEAVEFGCALAARRSSKVLRTSDLTMYMQRTHHLHIPGFSKEYTPYRRPVASDLHKCRSVAVRKAQLQPQQQGGGQGTAGKAGGAGVRFSVD